MAADDLLSIKLMKNDRLIREGYHLAIVYSIIKRLKKLMKNEKKDVNELNIDESALDNVIRGIKTDTDSLTVQKIKSNHATADQAMDRIINKKGGFPDILNSLKPVFEKLKKGEWTFSTVITLE